MCAVILLGDLLLGIEVDHVELEWLAGVALLVTYLLVHGEVDQGHRPLSIAEPLVVDVVDQSLNVVEVVLHKDDVRTISFAVGFALLGELDLHEPVEIFFVFVVVIFSRGL